MNIYNIYKKNHHLSCWWLGVKKKRKLKMEDENLPKVEKNGLAKNKKIQKEESHIW